MFRRTLTKSRLFCTFRRSSGQFPSFQRRSLNKSCNFSSASLTDYAMSAKSSSVLTEIDSAISLIDSYLVVDSSASVPTSAKAAIPSASKKSHKDSKKKSSCHCCDVSSKKSAMAVSSGDTTAAARIPGSLPNPVSGEDLETRVARVASVGQEINELSELRQLLAKKLTRPIAYDGFEPSGRMHIAQGILKSINVNKLTTSGVDFVFWVADWFALLNNKMGGDLQKIKVVGKYMIEVWKAAGMDMDHVYFKWASDEINSQSNDYWLRVMEISKMFSVTRTRRCCTILGRKEEAEMPTANLMYAVMQCADIFFLKADICQLGMDQRKVNMLAREYARKQKLHPPVVVSHPMLMGLKEGHEKMSKSDPDSAIFMEDSGDDVRRKIKKAFCPPLVAAKNPCLDYAKHIVFGKFDEFTIERKERNGGNVTFKSYEALEQAYVGGELHPGDLKPNLARVMNDILEPVRQHFKNDRNAKKLLAKVKKFKVTR